MPKVRVRIPMVLPKRYMNINYKLEQITGLEWAECDATEIVLCKPENKSHKVRLPVWFAKLLIGKFGQQETATDKEKDFCCKCGNKGSNKNGISISYHKSEYKCGYTEREDEGSKGEHLHYYCRICGYSWCGPVLAFYSVRDWPEDASHENGNYINQCFTCGKTFKGHKRRENCKACSRGSLILEARK